MRNVRMLAVTIFVCSVGSLTPTFVSAQQWTTTGSAVDQTTQGLPKIQGKTTPAGSCDNRTQMTLSWVEGLSNGCTSGSLFQGACRKVQDGGVDYYWNGYECTNVASPIVIATNPGQYRFTSAVDGVAFDIDGDGDLEQVAWPEASAEVAFLALDVDGDGRITSGKELFGDNTVPGVRNGFKALAIVAQASNGHAMRGSVSEDDPIYFVLLLWTDRNHNGVSEPEELRPAREVVSAIGLGYQVAPRRDGHGNILRYRGWSHLRTSAGRNPANSPDEDRARRRPIWDVFLTIQQ